MALSQIDGWHLAWSGEDGAHLPAGSCVLSAEFIWHVVMVSLTGEKCLVHTHSTASGVRQNSCQDPSIGKALAFSLSVG